MLGSPLLRPVAASGVAMTAAVASARRVSQRRAPGSLGSGQWSAGVAAGALLLALLLSLAVTVHRMPAMQPEDLAVLSRFPPRNLPDLVAQRDVLKRYAATYPTTVAAGLCLCYVLMQSAAVPGTLTLSLLAGALYGVRRGWLLVSVVSTLGSCSCYCLSWLVGRRLVAAAWPAKLEQYAAEVQRRRGEVLNYILFLRVTPILPNTFINVASPIVGVPLLPFALGTLLGCAPNNLVAVHAGSRLSELQSMSDLADARLLALGLGVGVVALAPVWLKRRALQSEQAAAATAAAAQQQQQRASAAEGLLHAAPQ